MANLFLNSFLSDCKFEYTLPIINQQGDIAGYLRVEINKDKHYVNDFEDRDSSNNSQLDLNSENGEDLERMQQKKIIKCIVSITSND